MRTNSVLMILIFMNLSHVNFAQAQGVYRPSESETATSGNEMPELTEATIEALSRPEDFVPLPTIPKADPGAWEKGLNIFGALGTNSSVYKNSVSRRRTGVGLSFATQIAYVTGNQMALEIGSIVNFNRIDGYYTWDTLFTLGVRARIPFLKYSERAAPYWRTFIGAGPSVIFFDQESRAYRNSESERVHLFGTVYGAAIGLMRKRSRTSVLFVEAVLAHHQFKYVEEVKNEGEVPVVVNRETLNDGSEAYHLSFLIGLRAF